MSAMVVYVRNDCWSQRHVASETRFIIQFTTIAIQFATIFLICVEILGIRVALRKMCVVSEEVSK